MSSSICWVGCWTWSVEHRACLKVVTIKNIPWGGVWPVAEMIRNLLIHNVTTQGCVMKSSVSLRTWLRTQSHIVELHNASFSSAGERLFKGSDCGPDSSIPSLCGWPWIQGLCKSDCSNRHFTIQQLQMTTSPTDAMDDDRLAGSLHMAIWRSDPSARPAPASEKHPTVSPCIGITKSQISVESLEICC